ncbi:uncharacterized protein LOC144862778 [Branchiostoma floridae x Branchiostoma japonicum]
MARPSVTCRDVTRPLQCKYTGENNNKKSNMAGFGLLIASLLAGATLVVADDICFRGDDDVKTCYGDFAYCCGLNNFSCCNDGYYVFSAWWFWMIWVIFVILFVVCGCVIRSRRQAANAIIQGAPHAPLAPPEAYNTTGTTMYGATYGIGTQLPPP